MKSFIHDDFLLNTASACELYHQYASSQPIIDYHCHLLPSDIATNRRFSNLAEIWLAGDHYKWRAMRLNGESEDYCTGSADPYEKFLAFAHTVPKTIRNPLYHWTHLELKRYFGIDTLLSERTAPEIWQHTKTMLASDELSAWGIMKQFKVAMVGTTDDPTDDLAQHQRIAEGGCPATVLPSFRPDKAFFIGEETSWNTWVDQLAIVSGEPCGNFDSFLAALSGRVEFFTKMGCKASDHGIARCPDQIASESEATAIFALARSGGQVSELQEKSYTGFLLCWLGERYAEQGWVMQLHLGAIRNVNRALYNQLGTDIGCDSIDDVSQVAGVATVLGELSERGKLPKTVLYNLDPSKNYAFAAMCGNFFEVGVPGKLQFGSGWWFLDQLEGMTLQMNALSSLGLLSNFIGMLTDSRSFMSYPRHEYFRRLLCRLLGQEMKDGQIPDDLEMVGELVSDVSFHNAQRYFGLGVNPSASLTSKPSLLNSFGSIQ